MSKDESATPEESAPLFAFQAAMRAAESLLAFLQQLGPEVQNLEASLLQAETRVRGLEAEVERLREHLRSAEELLAVPAPAASTPSVPSTPLVPPADEPSGGSSASSAPEEDPLLAWRRAGLSADDVRLVQRYFAESAFVDKMRAVRRSLGRPLVNLQPVSGDHPRVMATIIWEIVWYQYLVELAPEIADEDRVSAFAEGMEIDELTPQFRTENATLDQGGRIDASELELALLAQPPELLTEMTPDQAAALDDATQEIWDKRGEPEFRWDD